MKFIMRLWYRWFRWRDGLAHDFNGPLWRPKRDGWIYPDGTFATKRTDRP
jgi:hypothetical protein